MYHADLLGSAAAQLLGIPVVWGVHNAKTDPAHTPERHLRLVRVLARLSKRLPRRVVSCSVAARDAHERMGYAPERLLVIPNGFDMDQFKPDDQLRDAARRAWQVGPEHVVVGNIGRFHPHKDHHTFLRAAALVLRSNTRTRFVLYGDGVTMANTELRNWIVEAGLSDRCLALGPNAEIWKILPGLDLLVSSSQAEAFPLIVGEAMASGVPCVVTDVGDSAWLVGETGVVVPPGEPEALASAILEVAALDPAGRRAQGCAARDRIGEKFSLPSVAARYADVYREAHRTRKR
jgi:glycosyltransferase involved in cell wall biosynthesis